MRICRTRNTRQDQPIRLLALLVAICVCFTGSLSRPAVGNNEPVYIDSIAELLIAFPSIQGEGTTEDPFILSAFSIDANNADYALHLEGLNVPLILRGLALHSARGPAAMGAISLVNCSHIRIESCVVRNNDLGIRLFNCRDIVIVGNEIRSNGMGISIDLLSQGNYIYGNCLDNEINARDAGLTTWVGPQGEGNSWSDLSNSLSDGVYQIPPRGRDTAPSLLGEACGVADVVGPIISLLGSSHQTIECGTTYTDPGYLAHDDVDPKVAVDISGDVNTQAVGTYTIRYSGCDAAGNCTEATRTVTIKDDLAPVPSESCPKSLVLDVGKDPESVLLHATDRCDGALRVAVSLSRIDIGRLGAYQVTAQVCDTSRNCTNYTFEVRVVDRTAPTLELIGNDPLILREDEVARIRELDPGVLVLDNYDEDMAKGSSTEYPDLTDVNQGTIVYRGTDSSGNTASVERSVVVQRDSEAPSPNEGLPLTEVGKYTVREGGYDIIVGSTGGVWEWLSDATAWLDLGEYLMFLAENAPEDGQFLSVMISEASQTVGQFEIALSSDRLAWTHGTLGIIQFWRSLRGHDLGRELVNPFHPNGLDSSVSVTQILGEAVLSIILGPCPYSLEVIPQLIDGKTEVARVRVTFNSTTCSVEILDIPGLTELIGEYISELSGESQHVSVAAYADLYGLVYRIEFARDGSGTQSFIAYKHPGLFP